MPQNHEQEEVTHTLAEFHLVYFISWNAVLLLWLWQVMLTLLTQLELGEVQYIHLLPQLNVTCTLNFYKVGWQCNLNSMYPPLSIAFFECYSGLVGCARGQGDWKCINQSLNTTIFSFEKEYKPNESTIYRMIKLEPQIVC